MSLRYFTLLLSLFISSLTIQSQNLPDAFHFSTDGDRLVRGGLESTDFFDEDIIDTLFLEFTQPDYWTQMLDNYEDKIDILATLTINGNLYDSVGVRFRGQTSYGHVSSDKKSFNITLDYAIDGQDVGGYETLNLINGYDDPSFIREVLYFNICRNHISAPKGNFVTLFINGENWGLYSNIQQLDAEHVEQWYIDKESTRWRGEKTVSTGGGGPGAPNFGAGTSTLNYNGPDSTDYTDHYTLKKSYKANPWHDLVRACDLLNNTPSANLVDSLSKVLDIDDALWFLAHEILFTDQDSYVNKGGMDYYIYFDEATGRIVPQIYDGNSSINKSKANSWSPFYKENDTDFAMQNKLFAVPELRQRYLAHVRTILEESFDVNVINSKMSFYENLIDLHVQNDPKKLYGYNEFTSELSDVKDFFALRNTFVGNNSEVDVESPIITDVEFIGDGGSPESINVIGSLSHTSGIAMAYLYYGTGIMGKFSKIEMFDDGSHNDGTASDGVYGASIPGFIDGTWVRFYIEAVSANSVGTRSYSPVGAEHDVYIHQIGITTLANSDIVINELMSSNSITVADQDGEYDDWIELYNKSTTAVDIGGYFLSDDMMELTKWEIPAGTIIAGNGYTIIWADKDEVQTGLHSNFKLSADGESVYLSTPNNEIADHVVFDQHDSDEAYARNPNGIGNFVWQEATFNAENSVVSIDVIIDEEVNLNIFPNPANETVNIICPSIENGTIQVCSSIGQIIFNDDFDKTISLDSSNWLPGLYIVKVNGLSRRLLITH